MQVRVNNPEDFGRCGCGRSPTGYCIGWHGLNETQLDKVKRKWLLDHPATAEPHKPNQE